MGSRDPAGSATASETMEVLGAEGTFGLVGPRSFRELRGEADLMSATSGWRARRIDSPYSNGSQHAGWGRSAHVTQKARVHPNGHCCAHASVRVRLSMGDKGVRV
jgi:hypothetical protein